MLLGARGVWRPVHPRHWAVLRGRGHDAGGVRGVHASHCDPAADAGLPHRHRSQRSARLVLVPLQHCFQLCHGGGLGGPVKKSFARHTFGREAS